jgi:3-oxoacyl-[acyl-carrier protein] reductase
MKTQDRKVVLVSGGSRGLGQAICQKFLDNGYTVATFSRSKTDFIDSALDRAADRFEWRAVDVCDARALKDYVWSVQKRFGSIDCLINNAGATLDRLLPVTSVREIQDNLFVNLQSAITLTRMVSRVMLTQQRGDIVNISSILGTRGFKGVSVYSATKSALDGFSRSLARELGPKGIRVNSIAPGFLETDMTKGMAAARKEQIVRRTPLARLGKVEDVVGLVDFLISPQAGFITGQTFVVDGGLTC